MRRRPGRTKWRSAPGNTKWEHRSFVPLCQNKRAQDRDQNQDRGGLERKQVLLEKLLGEFDRREGGIAGKTSGHIRTRAVRTRIPLRHRVPQLEEKEKWKRQPRT